MAGTEPAQLTHVGSFSGVDRINLRTSYKNLDRRLLIALYWQFGFWGSNGNTDQFDIQLAVGFRCALSEESVLSQIIANLSLLSVGALFGASLYDAVVLAPNLRGGPSGLEHGRLFMTRSTPANLFRIAAPITQLLLLVSIIANWTNPKYRWPLVAALAVLIINDVITFTYHYPRNRLFFTAPLTVEPERLELAARQWTSANLIRVALVLAAWISTFVAVVRLAVADCL